MIWLLSGIFRLFAFLCLSAIGGILAMVPLAAACLIYSGQWSRITVQGIMSLENSAFAGALGDVLADNPIWNVFQVLLGSMAKMVNSGIDASVFFADAAGLNMDIYSICELVGIALFMIAWLRLQMDLMAGVLRTSRFAGSVVDLVTGGGSLWNIALNSINFSISLLGAFFSSVVFDAIRSSASPWVYLALAIAAGLIIALGIKTNARSYSLFSGNPDEKLEAFSIAEEVLSSLIKIFTLFMSMYVAYYYFSGAVVHDPYKNGLLIIGWIMGMHGLNGENVWWKLGGLASVVVIAILVI